MKIDVNCDMGESFGHYNLGNDTAIMQYISSCNIACGYHAGDPLVIQKTIENALKHQLGIGAHPSYPDLQGFGRRSMKIPAKELSAMIIYQISAVKGFTETSGGRLSHIKPHGALYNDISKSEELSEMMIETALKIDPEITLVGLADSITAKLCENKNIKFKGEFFADRNYNDEGLLVDRSKKNAVIKNAEEIAKRVVDFAKHGQVISINNQPLNLTAQTICIHGDHKNALENAREIHSSLTTARIKITNE